jgi:hypothetical protein
MGLTGVLIAFLLPILILVAYYPRKVFREAQLSAQNLKELLHESSLIGFFVAVCALISYCFGFQLSWTGLISCSAIYAAIFVVLLFSFSRRFRDEMNIAKGVLTLKVKTSF